MRNNAEQWYESLVKFHGKLFSAGRIPAKEDLQNADYHRKGFVWETNRILFNTPEDDIYHRPTLLAYYERHNAGAREYFRYKKNFLEINLADKDAYAGMCAFLEKTPISQDFQSQTRAGRRTFSSMRRKRSSAP